MRRRAMAGLALLCSACSVHDSTSNESLAPSGTWGSSAASLRTTDSSATIFFRDGSCYGSLGEITDAIPDGPFEMDGVFTQLMGVSPGRADYAAEFTGVSAGNRLWITVTVPTLDRTLGPFELVHGAGGSLSPCLYP